MKCINNVLSIPKAVRKIICSILVFAFLVISAFNLCPVTALAAIAENVSSFGDFASALANVDNGGEIIINNSFEITDTVVIPGGKEITISSASGNYFTLERAADFKDSFFSIPDTSTVNFTNIALDGKNYTANHPLIYNNGTLNINVGTRLTNNNKYAPSYVGGAIYNSGTLNIMYGSAISNCFSGSYGGSVQNEGYAMMSGGMIIGNTGEGGVQNAGSGTFTMTGGTITGNIDPYGNISGAGAGVQHQGDNFYISGDAKISSNNVHLNDRIIRITDSLSGAIAVYVSPDATDGTVIATGDGYTIQESDKSVFSVTNGYSLLIENNNIVLQAPSTPTPVEPTPDTPSLTTPPETTPDANIPVTGVTLDRENANILIGDALQLVASIIPSNASNTRLTWASSDGNVATVSEYGNVTGIKAGITTITVTTEDGGYTATCTVTVRAADVPKTGDTDSTWLWIFTGALSTLVGLCLSARMRQQLPKK